MRGGILLAALLCACGDGASFVIDAAGGGGGDGGAADASGAPDALPSVACTTEVATVPELEAALQGLGPGVTVCLAPGQYVLASRLSLPAARSGAADAPAVIAARDGRGTVTIDGGGNEESFYFTGARHVVLRGLRITGGAYHGVKIDPPSGDLLIADTVMFDNFRAGVDGQYSDVKGCCLVDRVTITDSEFYQEGVFTGDNYQGVDCNGCKSWVVRRSFFHDLRGAGYAVAIQFKSGSADTIIEDNVIRDVGIGVNYGGFGTPAWGEEEHEHVRGIVRNNVIFGCADAGISALDTLDGRIFHNTLYDNGFTPDVRRNAINLEVRNNVLDRPLNLRDGTSATQSGNVVLAAPDDGSLFVDAAGGDFHLAAGAAAAIDQGGDLGGAVPADFEGDPRPQGAGPDVGADER